MSILGQLTPLIDTERSITELMDTIQKLPTTPPCLYVDLEGVQLSRKGTISILQILVLPTNDTHLIDIHVLQDKAFTTPGSTGLTLKDVLESSTIPKVFFDVRRDSDALFAHYGIKLAGVQDIQLMELAIRPPGRKRHVNGLGKCIERDCSLSATENQVFKLVKEQGLNLFAPERGGSYEVFNTRPLSDTVRSYCIQDVQYMPRLWEHYNSNITVMWRGRVEQATRERVLLSQAENFEPNSKDMALGPAGWY
jgi:exonuclease 3'-5' domain-containing protein 1